MRVEQQSERSAQPAAAAGRGFSAFWSTTKQQHTNAQHNISYSLINVELNGIAFGMN